MIDTNIIFHLMSLVFWFYYFHFIFSSVVVVVLFFSSSIHFLVLVIFVVFCWREKRLCAHAHNYRLNTEEWFFVNKTNNFKEYSIIWGINVTQVMTTDNKCHKIHPRPKHFQRSNGYTKITIQWNDKMDVNDLQKLMKTQEIRVENQWIWRTICKQKQAMDF